MLACRKNVTASPLPSYGRKKALAGDALAVRLHADYLLDLIKTFIDDIITIQ